VKEGWNAHDGGDYITLTSITETLHFVTIAEQA
jgi:hypothetical protein